MPCSGRAIVFYPTIFPSLHLAVKLRCCASITQWMKPLSRLLHDKKAISLLIVAYLSFVWGTTYIAVKIAIRSVPVFMMAGVREVVAGLLLLVLAFVVEKPRRYSPGLLVRQGLYGLGFFTGTRGLMALALNYTTAGLVALIFSLIPVYVLFLNFFVGKFFINRKIIFGMLLGALGMLLVFRESLTNLLDWDQLLGIGVAFLAALSWAGTSVIVSEKKETMPPLTRASVQLFFGAAGLGVISFLTGESVDLATVEVEAVMAILYLAVFGSVIAFVGFMFAIRHLPVARATLYAYINPFVALFLGWSILGEPLSLELLLSFSVTLAGVFLVNRGYRND